MKRMFYLFIAFLLIANLTATSAVASEGTTGDYMGEIGTKFGRGLWNVITSPAEIPCTMNTEMKDRGGVGFFTGFGKGTLFMLRRILVGVTEVGTFVIPMPADLPPVCQPAAANVQASY